MITTNRNYEVFPYSKNRDKESMGVENYYLHTAPAFRRLRHFSLAE
jgi:hypothetical protein